MMVTDVLVKIYKKRKMDFLLTATGFAVVLFISLVAILAPYIAPYDPYVSVDEALLPPSSKHLMGTDNLGRDVYSRIIYGSRTVMVVVLTSTLVSLVLGSTLGLVSGYFGGKVDRVLSIIMDSLYSFPGLILAIAVAAMLGPGIVNTIVSISVVYIPTYFRMVRGQTLSVKNSLYVEAAIAMGASHKTVLFDYIFPNVSVIIPVVFSMNVADAVLTLSLIHI